MAASIYDNRRQGIQSKGKRDLVRFALSGLSCMCAATGKLLYFNICCLRKLNCLHFIWNLRVLRFLEGTSCLFDHWIRHRNGILECCKHSCGQITWWNHNVEEYIGNSGRSIISVLRTSIQYLFPVLYTLWVFRISGSIDCSFLV